jgi:prepilin-type N-terminal cleavage/methylation domain-containing protein
VNKRREGGFTMVEVLVAIMLTALAAAGIIGLYMVQTRASDQSRAQTEASILAQDQIERLRASSFTGTSSEVGLDAFGKPTGGRFGRSWEVNTVGSCPSCYSDMVVTVTWPDDNGRPVVMRARRIGK